MGAAASRVDADLVVVGGGPAGSALARHAARGGARVVLLEAARPGRDKTCGDALGLDALVELGRLGLADEVARAGGARIVGVRLGAPGGGEAALTTEDRRLPGFPDHTFVVPRRRLDALLLEAAAAAGAEVRAGAEVEGPLHEGGRVVGVRLRGGGALRADLVAGCAGVRDPVARAVGAAPPRAAFGARLYVEGPHLGLDRAIIRFSRFLLPGYGWIFPVGGGVANVGVGIRADLLPRGGGGIGGLLRRFREEDPVARDLLRAARPVGPVRGWPLPFGPGPRRRGGAGWVLCGDAASLVHPLTGEGIGHALLSARLAAEALLALGPEAAPAAYARALAARLDRSFRAAWRLLALLRRPGLLDRVVRRAATHHRYGTEIAAVVSGAFPAQRAVSPANLWRLLVGWPARRAGP